MGLKEQANRIMVMCYVELSSATSLGLGNEELSSITEFTRELMVLAENTDKIIDNIDNKDIYQVHIELTGSKVMNLSNNTLEANAVARAGLDAIVAMMTIENKDDSLSKLVSVVHGLVYQVATLEEPLGVDEKDTLMNIQGKLANS